MGTPGHLRFWRCDSSFARVMLFDPPGLGLSDPLPMDRVGALDEWTDAWQLHEVQA